ncbi:MAG: hypothetical protein EOO05_13990 [Chitinophagaceae bacterium]|nr:MAG: hypothetical protein EOO05_13990 [Chitinophagaceae bacterium]
MATSFNPAGNFFFEKKHSVVPQDQLPHLLKILWPVLFCIFTYYPLQGQSYDSLQKLDGLHATTYYSAGAGIKAKRMSAQIDSVISFYNAQLKFSPSVTLLLLSPGDWSNYTTFPFYGMPHYTSNKTLVIASEDNDYWRSMIPSPDKLPDSFNTLLKQTYTGTDGTVSMEPFFDLLAIHELGHAYSSQGGLVTQRRWMGELLPNILLHAYIAEKEPSLLPALTAFPAMVVGTTRRDSLKFTTLTDLEKNYNVMGPQYPQNYGWYQCRWHMSARNIYEAGGLDAVKKLWSVLKKQREVLPDQALPDLLARAHQSIADVWLNWDKVPY